MANAPNTIVGRMLQRMDEARISQRRLAELTGDSRRNVENWLSGTTMPADFVVRFMWAIPTNGDWLLTGEGEPDRLEEGEAIRLLSEIRRLLLTTPVAAEDATSEQERAAGAATALQNADLIQEIERGRQSKDRPA